MEDQVPTRGIHHREVAGARDRESLSRGMRAAANLPILIAGFYNPLTAAGGIGTVMRIIAPHLQDLKVVCLDSTAPGPYRHIDTGQWVYPISIPEDLTEAFHRAFCKSYVWPRLHEEDTESSVCTQNLLELVQKFSRLYAFQLSKVIHGCPRKALIWFNDYAMIPVLKEFRALYGEDLRIGLSVRSSFGVTQAPKFDERVREMLVEGMLSADVVSFHRVRDVAHFFEFLRSSSFGGSIAWNEHNVTTARGVTAVRVVPMGSSPEHWHEAGASTQSQLLRALLNERFSGESVILSVSRLEPHKGIEFEFEVMEQLLTRFPSLHGKFRFIRVTPVFAEYEKLPRYSVLKNSVERWMTRLNGQFGNGSWRPVELLIGRSLDHEELAGYYRSADILMVLSNADGFNHVSIEAVLAKQEGDRPLVLLLSDTGSSDYLQGAFIEAGSRNAGEVAAKLAHALHAGEKARRPLHASLLAAARTRRISDWMYEILGAIAGEMPESCEMRPAERTAPCVGS